MAARYESVSDSSDAEHVDPEAVVELPSLPTADSADVPMHADVIEPTVS
jgi:hypothetical protein